MLERMISNLVDNAVRHNEPGGWIRLRTGSTDTAVYLEIANSGPFIPDGKVPELFEPFRRGGQRRTGDGDSTGLGLSIVGAIAAAHGAALWAVPRAGGGLEVRVGFPCLPGQAGPVTMSPAMPSLTAG